MDRLSDKTLSGIIVFVAAPLVLVHGYAEDSSVWDSWMSWLKADNFTQVYPVTFEKDDQCGTVASHAAELNNIINKILNDTGSDKVNIVAHSKGGLDARSYIAHEGAWYYRQDNTQTFVSTDKVEKLVMIATPNAGTPAAYMDVTSCAYQGSAGLKDLQPGSVATQSVDQERTNYYVVAGDYALPCYFVLSTICYVVDNDGFVPVDSAKSHYARLGGGGGGTFPYNHTGLLTHKDVYQKVLPIID